MATLRQQSHSRQELSARVAEVGLTLPRQRLGGERLDAKNLRQRPVALAARWRPQPKLLATGYSKKAVSKTEGRSTFAQG